MSERYWRKRAAVVLLAGASTALAAGCGAGGDGAAGATSSATGLAGAPGTGQAAGAGQAGSGQAGTGQAGTGQDGTGQDAQNGNSQNGNAQNGANQNGQAGLTSVAGKSGVTAARLRDALLTKVDGTGPAAPVQYGVYSGLAAVRASKQSLSNVSVTPAMCSQATATGFDSSVFAQAPAAVATFRAGRNGVSEVLVGANARMTQKALENRLPAGCEHYQAAVAGKTFGYTVHEVTLTGVAMQAKALNVRATGYSDVNVWSVVFRGKGYLGAVTIVGPDATQRRATSLANAAYTWATESLVPKVH